MMIASQSYPGYDTGSLQHMPLHGDHSSMQHATRAHPQTVSQHSNSGELRFQAHNYTRILGVGGGGGVQWSIQGVLSTSQKFFISSNKPN